MSTELFLAFHSREDLRAFLDRNCSGDTLLLPRPEGEGNPAQFAPLTLRVSLPDQQLSQEGQVLQLLPDGQLVVGLGEPAVLVPALAQVAAAAAAAPPLVSWSEVAIEATGEDDEPAPDDTAAMATGPEYWPVEQIQTEWNALTVAQRISVARRGPLGARRMILKGQDHKLHQFVLTNPRITSGEVAAMASMTSLAPDLLKRIATQPEWLRAAPGRPPDQPLTYSSSSAVIQ